MPEPTSQPAGSQGPHAPVTGDGEVDEILADFAAARSEIEHGHADEASGPAPVEAGSDASDQDRLASVVHAAEEAHRRLQERLSADRD